MSRIQPGIWQLGAETETGDEEQELVWVEKDRLICGQTQPECQRGQQQGLSSSQLEMPVHKQDWRY